MSKNIRTQTGKIIGKTLNSYHARTKSAIDKLKFKEQYQGRIIDCMVGEIDDNYIETPETDAAMVKLEHSKEGVVKVLSMKGKTILVDAEGNETDTPSEGCRLVSVGENEDNKLIILSNNSTIDNSENKFGSINIDTGEESTHGRTCLISGYNLICTDVGYVKLYDINFNTLSGTDNYNTVTKRYYDKNKKYLGTNKTEDAFYVRYRCLTINNFSYEKDANNYIFKISEIGNKTYKQHKTEILLDEPLRRYDYIEGNKLYKNCKNLKIQSNFTIYNSQIWNDYYGVIMTIRGDFSDIKADRVSGGTTYFDKFIVNYNKWLMVADYQMQEMNMYILSPNLSSYINLFCKIPKTEVDSYDGSMNEKIEQWFNENAPMLDIIYQTTPIIEELPNGVTLQGFDDTTMYIENEITPTVQYGYNAVIPYKQALKEQKKEVETNTLDIENNIIPYLMDIEMNLMLMED